MNVNHTVDVTFEFPHPFCVWYPVAGGAIVPSFASVVAPTLLNVINVPSTAKSSAKQVLSFVNGIVNAIGPVHADESVPQTACT